MQRILYTRPDGGISIVTAAPKDQLERVLGPLTDEEYDAHVRSRSIPQDAILVRDIEDSVLPPNRILRNAWAFDGVAIALDKVKAQDLIRGKRDRALADLDLKAVAAERGNDPAELGLINADAARLRNIPQDVRFNGTDDDLKALYQEAEPTV